MKTAVIVSALAAAAMASPRHQHNNLRHVRNIEALHAEDKRDAAHVVTTTSWVTHLVTVTEVIDASTTQYFTDNQAPVPSATPVEDAASDAKFIEDKSVPVATPTLEAVHTEDVQNKKVKPTIVSTTTPVVEVPKTTATPVVPTTTAVVVPTVQPTTAAPVPTTAPSGPSTTGEITFYDIGLGACGMRHGGQDYSVNIVALSSLLMGEKSNDNPNCGRTISIHANGRSTTALVVDKCADCAYGNIDVSKKAFLELFDTLDVGRAPVEWSWM